MAFTTIFVTYFELKIVPNFYILCAIVQTILMETHWLENVPTDLPTQIWCIKHQYLFVGNHTTMNICGVPIKYFKMFVGYFKDIWFKMSFFDVFKMCQSRPIFVYFRSFQIQLCRKMCSLHRDSNSDRHSIRGAR